MAWASSRRAPLQACCQRIVDGLGLTEWDNVFLVMAYRSFGRFRQASTHLDTPPFSDSHHPVSAIARDPGSTVHPVADIIRFRMLMIAAGYEDGNDATGLRIHPLFKLALERVPSDRDLCSQSTISRLENLPDVRTLLRLGRALVDVYCGSFRQVPRRIVLDIDDTFDAVHGGQQLRLFNAHYDEYGFQPIVVFDAEGRFVTALLRPAKRPKGVEIRPATNCRRRSEVAMSRVDPWLRCRDLERARQGHRAPSGHEFLSPMSLQQKCSTSVERKAKQNAGGRAVRRALVMGVAYRVFRAFATMRAASANPKARGFQHASICHSRGRRAPVAGHRLCAGSGSDRSALRASQTHGGAGDAGEADGGSSGAGRDARR